MAAAIVNRVTFNWERTGIVKAFWGEVPSAHISCLRSLAGFPAAIFALVQCKKNIET